MQFSSQTNFERFLKQLIELFSQNLLQKQNGFDRSGQTRPDTNSLKPGELMVLTGSVECAQNSILPETRLTSEHTNYILEIKVMYTMFKEKPALVLLFSDITERSLVTILQENNNYKNRLLASVSHELRTPLNASINFTQEAIDHPDLSALPEIKENYLVPALRSSELLLFLINDILDFSQMSANKLRLVFENKNVHETLDECLNLIKIQAHRKGLKVSADYRFEKEHTGAFCTDHNRLKQIVLNLLNNALKFTLEGEIRIAAEIGRFGSLSSSLSPDDVMFSKLRDTIEVSSMKLDQRILRVSISDTGIGISDENKGKLFKAFEKIDLGEKSALNAQGVGLGLVISNNLVLSLGPQDQSNAIKVESEVNKGSTFTFWIIDHQSECCEDKEGDTPTSVHSENLCSDMKERMSDTDENENLETLQGFFPNKTMGTIQSEKKSLLESGNCRIPQVLRKSNFETSNMQKASQILIVDDDIFNICALQMILSKLGHACDTAYNGKQAIQKVLQRQSEALLAGPMKKGQYKVIFMDCNMPVMDGFEATRILKAKMKNKEIDPIAIVACTAFIAEQDKILATGIGVDSFCIKPVNKEKIADILKKYLYVKR